MTTEQTVIKGDWDSRRVYIDGQPLLESRSQKIRNHSPDGFSWGYRGSGCAQFALALMLEAVDEKIACKLYQEFKDDVISALPQADFVLSGKTITDWLATKTDITASVA